MEKYDKLVRDKIPEIIKSKGEELESHIAEDLEYHEKLKEKLREEVEEFLKDESPDEIADILEVIDALIEIKGFSMEEIQKIKKEKFEKKGGFSKKIILEKS